MRLSIVASVAAAAALVTAPVTAAPLRAGASLPTGAVDAAAVQRAAAPMQDESALTGVPIFAVLGLFAALTIVVVLVSGGNDGRSPG